MKRKNFKNIIGYYKNSEICKYIQELIEKISVSLASLLKKGKQNSV